MKKIIGLVIILILVMSMLAGCSSSETAAPQKSEEELKAEIRAQMEAEQKEKEELEGQIIAENDTENKTKLSEEELKAQFDKYQNELYEIQERFPSGYYANDVKESDFYLDIPEFKDYVDKVFKMGYGITQAEGRYYLYVGEEPQYTDGEVETSDNLIYTNGKNYWEYKPDTTVYVDLDDDGKDEKVVFDTKKGRLYVNAHFVPIDTMCADVSSFVIVDYKDKYTNLGKLIAVKDFGPSSDYTTEFFIYWTEVDGRKSDNPIYSVGLIGGLISPSNTYDKNNPEDFNTKLILTEEGIMAPVRMNIVQTWWGRNLFTYYSTYKSFIDNINKYNRDYDTDQGNNILYQKESNTYYREKDTGSTSIRSSGGQNVRMTKTDGTDWVYMVADDGTEGWVNVSTIKEPIYEGFQYYD